MLVYLQVGPSVSVSDAVSAAAAEVQLSGGSFKLLQQALTARTSSNSDSIGSVSSSAVPPGAKVARVAASLAAVPRHSQVVCHALELEDVESEEVSEDDAMLPNTNLTSLSAATDVPFSRHGLLPRAAEMSSKQHTDLGCDTCMSDQETSDSSDTDVDADVLIGSSTGTRLFSDAKPAASGVPAAASVQLP